MTDTSLRVRLSEERHAAALEKELGDLAGFDLQRLDGHWDATVDGVLGDKLVRVLNAVRAALGGEPSASALVFLDGREYEVGAQ
ncbi:MAG TPA: hypothetical protein VLJ44_07700 [Gaiellaceae bacterium]|nr:hypothetical protein [Gaiellaceae bacterium]